MSTETALLFRNLLSQVKISPTDPEAETSWARLKRALAEVDEALKDDAPSS